MTETGWGVLPRASGRASDVYGLDLEELTGRAQRGVDLAVAQLRGHPDLRCIASSRYEYIIQNGSCRRLQTGVHFIGITFQWNMPGHGLASCEPPRSAMNAEELVMMSVDDHVVEPPDMFNGHQAGQARRHRHRLIA
jgi:hypothetical protein